MIINRNYLLKGLTLGIFAVLFSTSCTKLNSVYDPHFSEDGKLIQTDTISAEPFTLQYPKQIKVYVEVSGSMNGFFRANKPTDFKSDVWEIVSYLTPWISEGITILTNEGQKGHTLSFDDFRNRMNQGSFVSSSSTKVPIMLQSIFEDYDAENGEVAILISDMKYSPVGNSAPDVLMTQYSTDISRILNKHHQPVCLIGATSNYLKKDGNEQTNKSPYYFFITGKGEHVAYIRNVVSTLLDNNGHFIDNIESGFDYGTPNYSFGIPDNCLKLDNEPTFYGYDNSYSDTCTVKLKIDLTNYRWIVATEACLRESLKVESRYGADVKIGNIKLDVKNITNQELARTAFATIDLKISNMPMKADVLVWNLELPSTVYTLFGPYVTNATNENDVTKSYSVESFIKGIFYGGIVNTQLPPNYILISKENN